MGLFSRKKENVVHIPKPTKEEFMSLVEALSQGGLPSAIEASIQKTIDGAHAYQMYENFDDQGNYFGSEFNIRATAGRIKGAYSREPWMFAAASHIARTLATVPFVVVDKATQQPIENHPLLSKIKMASRINDKLTNDWNGFLDLVLGGNYFRVFNETFTECMQYPVEYVQIKLDQSRTFIESLQVYDNDKTGAKLTIPYKQVVHHKYPNPFYPFYGMSIFTAAARPILLDRLKNEFEMAFYLRGATNSGVIETTEDINKSRMERLMRTFEQIYTGKRNWWRTIFLPKGAKWISSGLTMSEMQHLDGLRENRLTLLAVLGIPPSQVGIVQDVNRATAEAQERNFWLNTIKPMAEFVASGWNNSYLVRVIYGNRVAVVPDFSNIEALQGSLSTKGEQAKSIEGYFLIDEIRKKIFNEGPLPNMMGQRFVAEVRPAMSGPGQLMLSAAPSQQPVAAPAAQNPISEVTAATEDPQKTLAYIKAQAVESQERIERKLSDQYLTGYQKYMNALFLYAEKALRDNKARNAVENYLAGAVPTLMKIYAEAVEESLVSALNRGFSFASSQSKAFAAKQGIGKISTKRVRFNEIDQQAIDVLREEQKEGQRETLIRRAVEHFVGFNKTRTNEVLDIIADETMAGKTLDQIAATLRETYGEAYKNQAFTVARTELLTAISQGIKWNHDVLGEVFTDVQKQWLHVGDVGANPDARDWHADFEKEGPKPSDHKWGGILEFPRDPAGGAEETINCRCSMVSVIPDDADSNAEVILDRI